MGGGISWKEQADVILARFGLSVGCYASATFSCLQLMGWLRCIVVILRLSGLLINHVCQSLHLVKIWPRKELRCWVRFPLMCITRFCCLMPCGQCNRSHIAKAAASARSRTAWPDAASVNHSDCFSVIDDCLNAE